MLSSSPAVQGKLQSSGRLGARSSSFYNSSLPIIVGVESAHAREPVWRSEDSFMESIAFFYLYITFGD